MCVYVCKREGQQRKKREIHKPYDDDFQFYYEKPYAP